jgi:hypothetical protein
VLAAVEAGHWAAVRPGAGALAGRVAAAAAAAAQLRERCGQEEQRVAGLAERARRVCARATEAAEARAAATAAPAAAAAAAAAAAGASPSAAAVNEAVEEELVTLLGHAHVLWREWGAPAAGGGR